MGTFFFWLSFVINGLSWMVLGVLFAQPDAVNWQMLMVGMLTLIAATYFSAGVTRRGFESME